jgi:large subunit ribosomal protein LP0
MEGVTAGTKRKERKKRFKEKLEKLLQEYSSILVIGIDNVGSFQMQKIRIALRKKAVMIMGKNTMIRMIFREQMANNPKLEVLLPHVKGNMGFVFTNHDLNEVRSIITENKVPAAAKSGTLAPVDVFVPAGPTGLDPGQTSFFQALDIGTKISRGSIEIINTVHLIKKGDKVTSSAVALLGKLDIKPFFYGVVVLQVYEGGSVYPVHILDITQEDMLKKFFNGVRRVAALSLSIGYPTEASLPHSISNGFKKLLSLAMATNYKFKEMDMLTKAAATSKAEDKKEAKKGGGDGKKGGDKKADKPEKVEKVEKVEEKPAEEEEDVVGGFGDLFG